MKPLIIILFLCSHFLVAQKEMSHIMPVDSALETIYFTMNSVFDIQLHTTKAREIKVTAHSEGEYANYFAINEKRTVNTLQVTGDVTFMDQNFQDKLSAHKVHAISVVIWVPEALNIVLTSDVGNIKVSGNYESLYIDADASNCFLKEIKGQITASSISGAIHLETASGVVVTETNIGTIAVADIPSGKSEYHLKTNKGNITVTKL